MRAALDTNLLVNAEGFGDDVRVNATRQLLTRLSDADLVLPVRCLGELFLVLTGKAGRSAPQAQEAVLGWMDALVLNVAAEGGARLLLTEDLNPGFSWRGVQVLNPLGEPTDPLLSQLLG